MLLTSCGLRFTFEFNALIFNNSYDLLSLISKFKQFDTTSTHYKSNGPVYTRSLLLIIQPSDLWKLFHLH